MLVFNCLIEAWPGNWQKLFIVEFLSRNWTWWCFHGSQKLPMNSASLLATFQH